MIRKIINNFVLCSLSFLLSLYLHKGNVSITSGEAIYFAAFMTSWAVSNLLSRKFKLKDELPILNRLYLYTISFFLMMGLLALIIYQFKLTEVSRFVILNSLLIYFLTETGYLLYKNKGSIKFKNIYITYSIKAFTYEVILFGMVNLYLIYNLTGTISFDPVNLFLFIGFYLSWFAGSFLGHQFHPTYRRREYLAFIWQYIKSYIFILALSTFSTFINRIDPDKIMLIIYGIITYSILSFIGVSVYYYLKRYSFLVLNASGIPVKGQFGEVLLNEKVLEANKHYTPSFNGTNSEALNHNLKNLFLNRYPEVLEFLNKSINLNSFDNSYSLILKSNSVSNIDFLPNESLQLFLNLERINKIRDINGYLTEVNNKLTQHGIFAGNFETTYLRHQSYLKKYPYYFAQLFYFLDFLWNRVFAQIIILNKIHSGLTKDINNSLSLPEGLGRLYFCGFEVLHLKIIDNSIYFICKKIKEPVNDEAPSTGLIFKMKRIGKNGKPIHVYKFRSMYPYAQYLQEFIYDKFNLQEGGKFKNDFRVTFMGKIIRKLWLDELPMLINWFKGDMKLVGPRPLSNHYFNLYHKKLKEKRLKYKPGLIPPFYADNPKTLDEIMESEDRYLSLYEKTPVRTDIKYLIKCVRNIVIKGARSS